MWENEIALRAVDVSKVPKTEPQINIRTEEREGERESRLDMH